MDRHLVRITGSVSGELAAHPLPARLKARERTPVLAINECQKRAEHGEPSPTHTPDQGPREGFIHDGVLVVGQALVVYLRGTEGDSQGEDLREGVSANKVCQLLGRGVMWYA